MKQSKNIDMNKSKEDLLKELVGQTVLRNTKQESVVIAVSDPLPEVHKGRVCIINEVGCGLIKFEDLLSSGET